MEENNEEMEAVTEARRQSLTLSSYLSITLLLSQFY